MTAEQVRSNGQDIMSELIALRARCERQTGSMFTPMG